MATIIEVIPHVDGAVRYRVQVGRHTVRVDVDRFDRMSSETEGPRGRNCVDVCRRAMAVVGYRIEAYRRGVYDWP